MLLVLRPWCGRLGNIASLDLKARLLTQLHLLNEAIRVFGRRL